MFLYSTMQSPIGRLLLVCDGSTLVGLYTENDRRFEELENNLTQDDSASPFPEARKQLSEYFAGVRKDFSIPMSMNGTDFQKSVWRELCKISFGQTISYAELAERLGKENAARAVGNANGKNPISILVPCHRVIGQNGSLTGYAGGIECKKQLLSHEVNFV